MNDPNNPGRIAFSSQCLPGSIAEQKEKERLEEFVRTKAARKAEEERLMPEVAAQRDEEYRAHGAANQTRIKREQALRASRVSLLRP